MAWCIGRTEALADPLAARRKALAKLRAIAELDDPESLVIPVLIDAILMAESYRGARHQIAALNAPESDWSDLGIRVLEPGEEMSLDMRLDVTPK